MTVEERKSFCRICNGNCGVRIAVDENERMVGVQGDRADPMTTGYACIKGLNSVALHYAPDRILHPLKRQPDGAFVRIGVEQALDEIADRIREIVAQDGPEAIGGFRGGGAFLNTAAVNVLRDWLGGLGSHKFFSTITIDQSAKVISVGRIGTWGGGRDPLEKSELVLIVGSNPLVSIGTATFDQRNPTKRMKEVRARGMKLIVIDPRRTETARYADLFLQPYPGEDPSIIACMLRTILKEGLEDKAFCERWVEDLDLLREAVEPFTPEYVSARAGVPQADLVEAARLFARARRGYAASGTGPNMAPHSNLAEHLIECLNVVCGRYMRAGEQVPNPGVLRPRKPAKAQAFRARRWWESGYKSRIGGYGALLGDMMTGILADEILEPGPGRIRAFISHGSNLVNSIPDQRKITRALRSLDLLVSIEPFMNETASLSHYILPTPLMYERPDLTAFYFEKVYYYEPYARYTPAVVPPPAGSELVEDCHVFWGLAKRLGFGLVYDGVPVDMVSEPTNDDYLAIIARSAPGAWEELKGHELGKVFDEDPQFVEEPDPDAAGGFTTMPSDVALEMREVFAEPVRRDGEFTHRLSVRRIRESFNTGVRNVAALRARMPYNFAYMNPDELAALDISDGDKIEITSDAGAIPAVVAADPSVRAGVVSITHGWGSLPDETDYERHGSNTGLLISTDRDLDPINAMPRMSAIPVRVARLP